MQSETVEGFRLSPQQERLWKLCRDGADRPYRAACSVAIEGEIAPDALRSALRLVVERHEILRTTYRRLFGLETPLQVIVDEPALAWSQESLVGVCPEEQRRRVDAWLDPAGSAPFDLEQGPIVRAVLLSMGQGRSVLLIEVPSLCADAASLGILVAELSASLEGARGEAVQYADLAGWQNELLDGQDAVARRFWQSRGFLQGLDARLPFEKDGDFEPRRLDLLVPSGLPPAVLLSAWHLLLRRLTGRADVVVGVACDGRKYEEMQGALGLFSRYLPVQCELDEAAPLQRLADSVATSLEELVRWQETFTWTDTAGDSPFLPYVFEDEDRTGLTVAGGAVLRLDGWNVVTDRFRLKLTVRCRNGGTMAELGYDAGAIDPEDAGRLAEWYAALFHGYIERPEAPVSDLELLRPAERARLADRLRGPAVDIGPSPTLPDLFAAQAGRTPDSLAVVFEDRQLTYRDLDERSSRVARRLRALGVRREDRVALCLERSERMLVAILGILKTGAAYVPIDPAYPADRRALMLEDARAVVAVTEEWLQEGGEGAEGGGPFPDGLAYVIYTSGSTGRPKGVMVSHRAIANRLLWMQRVFPLAADDRVLQKTPTSFDASVWEIVLPLLAGACVVVAEPGAHQDAAALCDAVTRHGVTVLQLVPSFLPFFLEEAERRGGRGGVRLRRLFCGGEALPAALARRATGVLGCEVCNLYGPTEAAIDATFQPGSDAHREGLVPIGRPLDNVSVRLLDELQRMVPAGLAGELCIGGVGLARGYLGRPDHTAERFIPGVGDGGGDGGRLYRTGDLARLGPTGELEYLGRIDQQVKIRGVRVEPGEIEARLRLDPSVREAVVTAREMAPGDRRLVAYVVPQTVLGASDLAGLRERLAEVLPDALVPTAFVMLPSLPRLPNGKLDLRSLPEPSAELAEHGAMPPRTPAEEILLGIWAGLLRKEGIGVHDDFFESGGDSLVATQLVSRVRELFRVELRVRALFEAPTIAGLAERIAAAASETLAAAPPLVAVSRVGRAPLSYAQQRLWILDRIDPGSADYNLSIAVRLRGPLSVERLAAALGGIVRRHDTLRTTFATEGEEPVQLVAPFSGFSLPHVDLSRLGPAAEPEARRVAAENAARPFDLAAGPLFRPILIQLAPDDHAVTAAMHHIVSDGWSTGILVRELGALYQNDAPALPELPVQYADFAAWQRSWLSGPVLEAEVGHWRSRLAGLPARLDLPADRPRPAARTTAGAWLPVEVPEDLAEDLRRIARAEGVTVFMLLLAAFEALLARLAGQEDFGVGTPIAGRNRLETEGLIGFFVNTLVLRADLSGDPRFRELLARVRAATLEAYAHQDLPFEKLVEELAPERSLAHTPLFQVMFLLQNAGRVGGDLDLPGIAASPFGVPGTVSRFDLTLTLADSPGGALPGTFEYSTELWNSATVGRLAERYERLLRGLAADPGRRLSELPLLSEAELRQLLDWNAASPSVFAPGSVLQELFERQADLTPGAVAVEQGARSLTYAELEARANGLARTLRGLGVGPETRVALCVGRSSEMLVGLLGILKAGGAYVPLDPEYPRERLALMLEDAGVMALVTEEGTEGLLPDAPAGLARVAIPRTGTTGEPIDSGRFSSGTLPDNPAYVIYTSGSTGRPKGVQIPHGALVNFLGSMQERLALGAGDVWVAVTSLSFDIAALELFLPLVTGARVVIADRDEARDGRRLADLLHDRGATVLQATPSTWRLLVETGWSAAAGLKMLCGGEALPRELASRLLTGNAHETELWNVYGPTETTVWSAALRLSPGDGPVPIGGPLAATGLHGLDRWDQPAPVGVPCELLISGDGLARGYLGRPDLTAERFVPGPDGGRRYRTGDLVRRRADGLFDFLGRIDHQLKVRGYRIEPGEIEAVLEAHPAVRQAVVHPVDDALVAWVVLETALGTGLDGWAAELRRALTERLPPAMVPSAWVALESFPLTPNGKIDRRALPKPTPEEPSGTVAETWTPTEELLAGLWSDVLGGRPIGSHDDFFEIGGHSLLGTRVLTRVREAFGVDLPLRRLFEHPTVSGLATLIDAERGRSAPARRHPLTQAPRDGGPRPLSFSQQRLWFLDRLEPGNPYFNISGALRLSGELEIGPLEAAVREIARRHEVLRTRYEASGGVNEQPFQIVEPDNDLRLAVEDLTGLPAELRETAFRRRLDEESRRPFDLAAGPVFRVRLLRLDRTEHVAVFSLHHIAGDGWSFGVLTSELAALYEAFRFGAPSPLAELPVQYADFAAWQRGWLAGETLEGLLAWWRGRLEGAPPALDLPFDRPRIEGPTPGIATLPAALPVDPAVLRKLGRRAGPQGATLFMTLLAALQVLLGRLSNQDDVVVGTPIANRTTPETERLIGFFVNTLALRMDFADDPTFGALLARVAETTLGDYDHQDLPFERLVEELQPERSLARTPLFQVLFVLQNAPGGPLRLPGLTLAPVGLARTGSSPFDLTLALAETADGLSGSWEYSPDMFDEATVRRIAGCFGTLLKGLAGLGEGWDRRVSELPLLDEAERRQILVEWNPDLFPLPPVGLHDLVRAQAGRTPDAVALVCGTERLTYAELGRRVADRAQALRGLGVGPEVLVGVLLERSAEMMVSLLAVLEAGSAYVPLDPRYPQERLAYLLEDSGAVLLVTQAELLDLVPESPARVVTVDSLDPYLITVSGPADPTDPDTAAYVIYTSGSTGQPKGVVIRHRSAVSLVEWARTAFPAEALSGVLASTSICFDLSIFEIFVPLALGGTVILAENALALPELDAETAVTLINTVPSAMTELVRLGALPPSLRVVNLAGEPLRRELAARVQELTGAEVWNLYGPSEDTTYSTGCLVPPGAEPTIGRPLAKARAFVLDAGLEPVPAGVTGEIWLGGDGLARGYLRRPDLTAERFRPDPFADLRSEPGARIYRTGDLGRWLPGGEIGLLGRRDQQVKIRGFRVEMGEVEAALSAVPGVIDAAVVARDGALVAWVVGKIDADTLRPILLGRLPEPLVPSRFVVVDALPLTPNGKVDRKALAERSADLGPAGDGGGEAPRTPTEELVAGIFADLLRRESVGAADDFFELGGHSLLATQVVSRVRSAFGIDLPLRTVFERKTAAALAELIDAATAADPELAASVVPVPRDAELPLSFAQQRLWFLDRVEPGSPAYNLPAAVRLRGPLSPAALAAALRGIVDRHEGLRATFPATAVGEPLQTILPEVDVRLPVIDLRGLTSAEAEAARLAAAESRRPFDLARGPLIRGVLIALADEEHLALLTLHHIVSDGWSMGILVRELAAFYQAALHGGTPPLPGLAVQVADFAAWQARHLQGPALERLTGFWSRQLAGAPLLLELPGARLRPPVQTGQGATRDRRLDAELSREIQALARHESATLFMTLLAAFAALVHARTGGTDLVIGTDVAGRTRHEVEPLIGFFVNQLALRAQLGGNPSFCELLARSRETALAAYAHQDLPFDRLVDGLRIPRSLAASPVFQVKLVLQNAPAETLELPGLTLSPVDAPASTAQLDLNLRVVPTPAGLYLSLQYATDLYDAPAMERLLEQLEEVLRVAVARPEIRLEELAEALRETERSRWEEREREAKAARRGKLVSTRRTGAP